MDEHEDRMDHEVPWLDAPDPRESVGYETLADTFPANVKLKQGEIPKRPIMPPNREIREGDKPTVQRGSTYRTKALNNAFKQWLAEVTPGHVIIDAGWYMFISEAFKAGFRLGIKEDK